MLATAAAHPGVLAIGVDANAASLAGASRRAARGARRGGLPNAVFVVAAAEALPAGLNGIATALTVHFPWGSLLHGLLGADPAILSGLVRVTRPGGGVTLLLSVTERDRVAGLAVFAGDAVERVCRLYAAHGLALTESRPATVADVAASHSTWAKRLGAGSRRTAWVLRFRVCGPLTPAC